jgi:hypothetical protein
MSRLEDEMKELVGTVIAIAIICFAAAIFVYFKFVD